MSSFPSSTIVSQPRSDAPRFQRVMLGRAQTRNAVLERRMTHEQARQARAFAPGEAKCLELRRQRSIVRVHEPPQRSDHLAAPRQLRAARVGAKFALA